MSKIMYDDITLSLLPPGAYAYAGYVNGRFANMAALRAKFPNAHLLDISVFASGDATCLDVETGDATIAQIFTWFNRQQLRNVFRPVIYTQASNLSALYLTMSANGFARNTYRVWSAHYTNSAHFCGPATCGFSIGGTSADATQWTDVALGRSLDESAVSDNFFAPPPPPPGMATQPAAVRGTAKYTNATITWTGAKDVTGYWADLIDMPTGAHLDHVEISSTDGSGAYVFRHLKMKHQYKLGIYARPGVTGSHSTWVEVTTK